MCFPVQPSQGTVSLYACFVDELISQAADGVFLVRRRDQNAIIVFAHRYVPHQGWVTFYDRAGEVVRSLKRNGLTEIRKLRGRRSLSLRAGQVEALIGALARDSVREDRHDVASPEEIADLNRVFAALRSLRHDFLEETAAHDNP